MPSNAQSPAIRDIAKRVTEHKERVVPSQAKPRFDRPTSEREGRNTFHHAGAAVRVTPVIDTLHRKGRISQGEFDKLKYYRDQASLADRSPVKSGIDFSVSSGGNGPGLAITSAMIETGRMERDMGPLWHIARAVAVDDVSLSQWCITQHGGTETKRDGIVPRKGEVDYALIELKFAVSRLVVR